jgi:oligosaccharide repeat unit polymerase
MMNETKEYENISFLPFVYLYICILLLLSPFKKLANGWQLNVVESKFIKFLTRLYIICGIIAIYYTIPDAVDLIQSGQWGILRQMLYEDQDEVILYHSQFERIVKNIQGYLNPFGIVMCFYQLSNKNRNKIITAGLFVSWIGNEFLSATLVASRGLVALFLLKIILLMTLFKNHIGKLVKRVALFGSIVLSIPLTMYLVAVSISRFGESDAGNSLFMYLGHSMLSFNERLMGSMSDFAYGRYCFDFFLNFFGIKPLTDFKTLGCTGQGDFYTIIGSFYLDWGPIGTILVVLSLMSICNYFCKKKKKQLSDMLMIVYFSNFCMSGVFVVGRGYGLQVIMIFLVYFVLRYMENRQNIKLSNS